MGLNFVTIFGIQPCHYFQPHHDILGFNPVMTFWDSTSKKNAMRFKIVTRLNPENCDEVENHDRVKNRDDEENHDRLNP